MGTATIVWLGVSRVNQEVTPSCLPFLSYQVEQATTQDQQTPLATGLAETIRQTIGVNVSHVTSKIDGNEIFALKISDYQSQGLPDPLDQHFASALIDRTVLLEYRADGSLTQFLSLPGKTIESWQLDAIRPWLASFQFDRNTAATEREETDSLGLSNFRYQPTAPNTSTKTRLPNNLLSELAPKVESSVGTIRWGNDDVFFPLSLELAETHKVRVGPESWANVQQSVKWQRQTAGMAGLCQNSSAEMLAGESYSLVLSIDREAQQSKLGRLGGVPSTGSETSIPGKRAIFQPNDAKKRIEASLSEPKDQYEAFGNLVDYAEEHPETLTLVAEKLSELKDTDSRAAEILIGVLSSVRNPKANETFILLLKEFSQKPDLPELKQQLLLGYQVAESASSELGIHELADYVGRESEPSAVHDAAVLALGTATRRLPDEDIGIESDIYETLRQSFSATESSRSKYLYLAAIGNLRSPLATEWLREIACCDANPELADRAALGLIRISGDASSQALAALLKSRSNDDNFVSKVLSELAFRHTIDSDLAETLEYLSKSAKKPSHRNQSIAILKQFSGPYRASL